MIISQSFSTLLIGKYAKAAHNLHVESDFFFASFLSLDCTIRLILISCLHRH